MLADPQTQMTARSGYSFIVRPAEDADAPALADFFDHVAASDLRFRFLSAVAHVPVATVKDMVHVDHDRIENLLAFDPETGAMIATAMLAGDAKREVAEVAVSIHADFKGRGVAWMLLEELTRFAKTHGFKKLQAIESRDNHQAIELEREMGFVAHGHPDDATLVILEADLMQ